MKRPALTGLALLCYNGLFAVLLLLASPWLLFRLATRERYRTGLLERIAVRLPPRRSRRPRLWLHAASAGEMVAVAALARALKRRRPELELVLSSTTTSGRAVAERLLPELFCFLLPLDFWPLAGRVVDRVDPLALVLVELELWPSLVHLARRRGIRLAVANGRIGAASARRYRFGPVRRLIGFGLVDLFAVQNQVYRERLMSLGVPAGRIEVTGNLKVDVADPEAAGRDRIRAELGFQPSDLVLVCGSTHAGEEGLIGRAVAKLCAESDRPLKLVIAPRHRERLADAERDLKNAGLDPVRLTRLRQGGSGSVVVVDTMGELAGLYRAADLAIVGGSLVPGIGGHNLFEPVLAGARTLVGPHHKNVRSDLLFLEQAGALSVVQPERLHADLCELIAGGRPCLDEAVRRALLAARGAAERTCILIEQRCLGAAGSLADQRSELPANRPSTTT